MGFGTTLEKIGIESLKIGAYVLLGIQGTETAIGTVSPSAVSPGSPLGNIFNRAIQVVQDIEKASAALGSSALTGPQKLQQATAIIANDLRGITGANAKIADADSFAKSAQGIAQSAVDYINAFEQGLVTVKTNGETVALAAAAAYSSGVPTSIGLASTPAALAPALTTDTIPAE